MFGARLSELGQAMSHINDWGIDLRWPGWATIASTTHETLSPANRSTIALEMTEPEEMTAAGSLNDFLTSVERRAFRMAQVSAGDRDVALDIVQDSMMKLVQNYSDKPAAEWRPLFFRILNNRITDWHRSQSSRWAVFDRWFGNDDDEGGDPMDQLQGQVSEQPDHQLLAESTMTQIEAAIGSLSPRQQQAFMLRCWEGLSTLETATTMGCSEGTVKTLYARSLSSLRQCLGENLGATT